MLEETREQRFHIKIYNVLKKKGFPVNRSIPVFLKSPDYIFKAEALISSPVSHLAPDLILKADTHQP